MNYQRKFAWVQRPYNLFELKVYADKANIYVSIEFLY
jgi:hypothetical protein